MNRRKLKIIRLGILCTSDDPVERISRTQLERLLIQGSIREQKKKTEQLGFALREPSQKKT